jgi:predicted transposase YdaD
LARLSIEKNAFLRDIRDAAILQGRQECIEAGREEGREAGVLQSTARTLARQLGTKFGPLPKWAKARLGRATTLEEGIGWR